MNDTTVELDSERLADSHQPGLAHYYCTTCYPTRFPGMKSRCGINLLGLRDHTSDQCVVCLDLSFYDCLVCGK